MSLLIPLLGLVSAVCYTIYTIYLSLCTQQLIRHHFHKFPCISSLHQSIDKFNFNLQGIHSILQDKAGLILKTRLFNFILHFTFVSTFFLFPIVLVFLYLTDISVVNTQIQGLIFSHKKTNVLRI